MDNFHTTLTLELEDILYGEYPDGTIMFDDKSTHWVTFKWAGNKCSMVGDVDMFNYFDTLYRNGKTQQR